MWTCSSNVESSRLDTRFKSSRNRPETDCTRGMLFSCPCRVEPLGWQHQNLPCWVGVSTDTQRWCYPVSSLVRNVLLHAFCSLRPYSWCWYSCIVSILVRARVLSARGMLFLCARMIEPLGWCWYSSMGMVWYVVQYGVWCGTVCHIEWWYGLFCGYTIWNNHGMWYGMLMVWYDGTMWWIYYMAEIAWWYAMFQCIRSVRVEYVVWI